MKRFSNQAISTALAYIETHLEEKMTLEDVAETVHYSPFYLHRLFRQSVGMTLHDYVQRRQMTEAARLLAFSQRTILEIALSCGCESQQAFSGIFKALYKQSPAEFRARKTFYPLQLSICLEIEPIRKPFTLSNIVPAGLEDIEDWMSLLRSNVDGFPGLNEAEHRESLQQAILDQRAWILRDGSILLAAMGISYAQSSIDFLAIRPEFRKQGIAELFLKKLQKELLTGREISTTTYREGDRADTGYRAALLNLGFVEREFLVEYGYPTQRLAFFPEKRRDA